MWPPGTEVERIKDPHQNRIDYALAHGCDVPQRGVVYVVEKSWEVFGVPVIHLVGMRCPATPLTYEGYMAEYFREVKRKKTDISVFTAILDKHKVTEPA